jgi:hypothetical protein
VYEPILLRDRPRPAQVVLVGVIPAVAGGVAGVLVGVSSGAYWAYAALATIGAIVAGFEHQDGRGAADRGLVAGLIYGSALLAVHAILGTHATVSLGSFPPLLVVITAIAGMLLTALGGRIARMQRERKSEQATLGEGQQLREQGELED